MASLDFKQISKQSQWKKRSKVKVSLKIFLYTSQGSMCKAPLKVYWKKFRSWHHFGNGKGPNMAIFL